jgi:hypothetical protein
MYHIIFYNLNMIHYIQNSPLLSISHIDYLYFCVIYNQKSQKDNNQQFKSSTFFIYKVINLHLSNCVVSLSVHIIQDYPMIVKYIFVIFHQGQILNHCISFHMKNNIGFLFHLIYQ